jgi:hypothetical protein
VEGIKKVENNYDRLSVEINRLREESQRDWSTNLAKLKTMVGQEKK